VTKGGETLEGGDVRHLYGTALAVAMTAIMFFAGSWGYLRLLKLPVPPGQLAALPAGGGSLLGNSSMLLALAAVVGPAVLAGLLVMLPRISPLAAGLPGLLLLAWTALYLVSVRRAVTFIPLRSHAFGAGWEGLLFNGVLGAAGAVLVFPLFIPSRWRAARVADVAEPDASAREVDDYLTAVTAVTTGNRTRPQPEEESTLVGTVMPGSVKRVDTTRITGASRALRNTGSFRVSTGSVPRATGPFPGDGASSLLGRPYVPSDDRPYPPPRR
jgi:hypothetical protein